MIEKLVKKFRIRSGTLNIMKKNKSAKYENLGNKVAPKPVFPTPFGLGVSLHDLTKSSNFFSISSSTSSLNTETSLSLKESNKTNSQGKIATLPSDMWPVNALIPQIYQLGNRTVQVVGQGQFILLRFTDINSYDELGFKFRITVDLSNSSKIDEVWKAIYKYLDNPLIKAFKVIPAHDTQELTKTHNSKAMQFYSGLNSLTIKELQLQGTLAQTINNWITLIKNIDAEVKKTGIKKSTYNSADMLVKNTMYFSGRNDESSKFTNMLISNYSVEKKFKNRVEAIRYAFSAQTSAKNNQDTSPLKERLEKLKTLSDYATLAKQVNQIVLQKGSQTYYSGNHNENLDNPFQEHTKKISNASDHSTCCLIN